MRIFSNLDFDVFILTESKDSKGCKYIKLFFLHQPRIDNLSDHSALVLDIKI